MCSWIAEGSGQIHVRWCLQQWIEHQGFDIVRLEDGSRRRNQLMPSSFFIIDGRCSTSSSNNMNWLVSQKCLVERRVKLWQEGNPLLDNVEKYDF